MRNFLKCLLIIFLFSLNNVKATNKCSSITVVNKIENAPLIKKTFKGSITLSGGCKVDYSITVDYSILPPAVNSIHGTVTLSGNCSGTQSFRVATNVNSSGIITRADVEETNNPTLDSQEFKYAISNILVGIDLTKL